jgi:hypothetical protein
MKQSATRRSLPSAAALVLVSLIFMLPGLAQARPKVTLPLVEGYYNGESVYYVNTDASDAGVAAMDGTTFVPKLATAIDVGATADLFHVTNFNQPNVLDSVPYPLGAGNTDPDYSPLWLIHLVTWAPGTTPELLTSEAAVLAAQAAGKVSIQATRIVVNCPVVATPRGQLPSALEVEIEREHDSDSVGTITLPLVKGFVHGKVSFYINTDASDANVAATDGTNYVPKLAHTHASGAEADIFPFIGKTHPAQRTVLSFAPNPVGPKNGDVDYSPLWDVVPVTFANQAQRTYPLVRSADTIQTLVTRGTMVSGPEPGIVINCPVVR